MPTFVPTLQCPIIRNFECVQEECAFWNAEKAECIHFDGLAGKKAYNEIAGTIAGGLTDEEVDLGAIYKDITIFVDQECTVKFHDVAHPSIYLDDLTMRRGVAVIFRNINAQKLYVTTTVATAVTVFGNG